MEQSCPATPLILTGRDSKSPLQIALSSPESDGRKSPSRDSPDSRCVICLGRLQNKSFTDSCLHQFCFQCLLQWSKIKAECPLCKQPFKSIIHNVRSNLDYDQYHVEHGEPRYVLSDLMHSYNFDLIPINRRFRYRSTMTRDYFRELAASFLAHSRRLPENSYQINPLVPVDPAAASSVRRSNCLNSTSSQYRTRQRGTSDFRRNVYAQDLWVQDLADISGRYRECTPQFYRENPAQIHRIIPWLNREVNVLLSDCESHAAYVLSRIISLLTQHSIRSREFRGEIQSYFGDRTDHFIHELYTFARSLYDMVGFDQNAVYGTNPNYATEVQEISSSSAEDSDIEIIDTEIRVQKSKKSCREFKDTRHGLKKLLLKRASTDEPQLNEPVAGPSGVNSTRVCDSVVICESDSEEIKVLDYVKPKPEIVILSSDEEAPAYSDLDASNGEYAEVIHSDITKSKLSSYCDSEKKKHNRTRTGKGKCKSNGFGLKGKQKRKYIKLKKHRCSTSSINTSSRSRSSSSSSSYSSSSSTSNSSSSISSSSSSSSSSCCSSTRSNNDSGSRRSKKNNNRKSISTSSSSSESCESVSDSSSSRSSYGSSKRERRKKSSVNRKKSKKKVIHKTSKRQKSSTDTDKRKRKRVKSSVIVPNFHGDSSSLAYRRRSSPEPERFQSYWSVALPEASYYSKEWKPKRKHRESSNENKSKKRYRKNSTSSERNVRSENNKTSGTWTSQEATSSRSGNLPSACVIPSSGTFIYSNTFSLVVQSASNNN